MVLVVMAAAVAIMDYVVMIVTVLAVRHNRGLKTTELLNEGKDPLFKFWIGLHHFALQEHLHRDDYSVHKSI